MGRLHGHKVQRCSLCDTKSDHGKGLNGTKPTQWGGSIDRRQVLKEGESKGKGKGKGSGGSESGSGGESMGNDGGGMRDEGSGGGGSEGGEEDENIIHWLLFVWLYLRNKSWPNSFVFVCPTVSIPGKVIHLWLFVSPFSLFPLLLVHHPHPDCPLHHRQRYPSPTPSSALPQHLAPNTPLVFPSLSWLCAAQPFPAVRLCVHGAALSPPCVECQWGWRLLEVSSSPSSFSSYDFLMWFQGSYASLPWHPSITLWSRCIPVHTSWPQLSLYTPLKFALMMVSLVMLSLQNLPLRCQIHHWCPPSSWLPTLCPLPCSLWMGVNVRVSGEDWHVQTVKRTQWECVHANRGLSQLDTDEHQDQTSTWDRMHSMPPIRALHDVMHQELCHRKPVPVGLIIITNIHLKMMLICTRSSISSSYQMYYTPVISIRTLDLGKKWTEK